MRRSSPFSWSEFQASARGKLVLILEKYPRAEYTNGRNLEEVRELFGLGTQELVIILAIVFLIFGAKKLPEIGSGLGKAIKNFKGGVKSIEEGNPEKPPERTKDEAKDSTGSKPV
jgi:sec-independent protein translocase protein TatA